MEKASWKKGRVQRNLASVGGNDLIFISEGEHVEAAAGRARKVATEKSRIGDYEKESLEGIRVKRSEKDATVTNNRGK